MDNNVNYWLNGHKDNDFQVVRSHLEIELIGLKKKQIINHKNQNVKDTKPNYNFYLEFGLTELGFQVKCKNRNISNFIQQKRRKKERKEQLQSYQSNSKQNLQAKQSLTCTTKTPPQ